MTKHILEGWKMWIKENLNVCFCHHLCGPTRGWATCWNDRGAVAHLMKLGHFNLPYNMDSDAEGHRM